MMSKRIVDSRKLIVDLCRAVGLDPDHRPIRSIEIKLSCDEPPVLTIGEWITEGPAAGLVEVLIDYRLVPVEIEGA